MPRRKKLTPSQRAINWLEKHRKTMWLLLIVLAALLYLLIHAYRGWADTRRLHSSRAAIDSVYTDITKRLGQPDDLRTSNSCVKQGNINTYTLCTVETDFIYGASNQNLANVFLGQIQKVIGAHRNAFKPTRKLSVHLGNALSVEAYTHDATDYYRGPYGSACSVKYSFATPDEVDLSLRDPSLQPFEVFFSCSHKSVRAIYPAS